MKRLALFLLISTCLLLWAAPGDRFASWEIEIESDSHHDNMYIVSLTL